MGEIYIDRIKYDWQRFSTFLIILFMGLFIFNSCENAVEEKEGGELASESEELQVSIQEPIKRDFAEIKQSGVLRMITFYSSNTYFLNQGIEVGFEYELVREFARENDLALEVVVVGTDENPFDLLNSGDGDLIAANYTITPERRKIANFSRPYNLVDQQIVYSTQLTEHPQTLEELSGSGIPISIRRNSSYYGRVMELIDEGYDLEVNVISDAFDTEAALVRVSEGDYEATIADDNMFNAANRYVEGLIPGPEIAEQDTIAWAIRHNSPDLETRMNQFLYKHFRFSEDRDRPRRSTFLNILRKRYFEESQQIAEYHNPEWQYQSVGIISPYDEMVKQVADSMGLDWVMLTAMIAQESEFNPNSKSWAGAVGLMQVIPRFVETDYELLYDPLINIKEGARIIKEHLDHYAYMDSTNQWSMALATYNSGLGHIADARRLVIDQNKNPNEWENVADALLKLMQSRYHQDARFGFARGIETVQYVNEIMNRYRTYETILALSDQRRNETMTNLIDNSSATRVP